MSLIPHCSSGNRTKQESKMSDQEYYQSHYQGRYLQPKPTMTTTIISMSIFGLVSIGSLLWMYRGGVSNPPGGLLALALVSGAFPVAGFSAINRTLIKPRNENKVIFQIAIYLPIMLGMVMWILAPIVMIASGASWTDTIDMRFPLPIWLMAAFLWPIGVFTIGYFITVIYRINTDPGYVAKYPLRLEEKASKAATYPTQVRASVLNPFLAARKGKANPKSPKRDGRFRPSPNTSHYSSLEVGEDEKKRDSKPLWWFRGR